MIGGCSGAAHLRRAYRAVAGRDWRASRILTTLSTGQGSLCDTQQGVRASAAKV